MECFLIFIVLLITVTVILSLGSRSQWRSSRRNALFRRLADRFHGNCQTGNWFSPPSTRLRYGESLVVVDVDRVVGLRDYGAMETRVHFGWPEAGFRCEVASRTQDNLESGGDLTEFRVDGDDFDRHFQARANDGQKLRRLLSTGVQWQLARLLDGDHRDPVRMSLADRRLSVSRQTEFTTYEGLEQFVRLAMDLYDQAMLTKSVGIEFLESDEAQVVQEARCQVCGEDIDADMVFCRRCKTPHHLECWQYTGSCSTYGCREPHYLVPRVARPAPKLKPEASPNPEAEPAEAAEPEATVENEGLESK